MNIPKLMNKIEDDITILNEKWMITGSKKVRKEIVQMIERKRKARLSICGFNNK